MESEADELDQINGQTIEVQNGAFIPFDQPASAPSEDLEDATTQPLGSTDGGLIPDGSRGIRRPPTSLSGSSATTFSVPPTRVTTSLPPESQTSSPSSIPAEAAPLPTSILVDDADSPDSLAYTDDDQGSVWRNPITWVLGGLLLASVAFGRRGGRSRGDRKVDNESAL